MYFAIAFSSSGRGRLSALAPPRRTSGPRIDTAPEKCLAATRPNPSDPRFARQTWPSATTDTDALLIGKLIVAAVEGGDAHRDLRRARLKGAKINWLSCRDRARRDRLVSIVDS
jgi:hypothetical protein